MPNDWIDTFHGVDCSSSELIIRCIDRRLETRTIFDNESLELFLHDHIVSLWENPGWMTAKFVWKRTFHSYGLFCFRRIIAEVLRLEYRPLRDAANPTPNPSIQVKRRCLFDHLVNCSFRRRESYNHHRELNGWKKILQPFHKHLPKF